MTPKGITRSLLALTLQAAIVFFAAPASADLRLQQTMVLGFPVDGIADVAQIDPSGPGGHRLAVLHSQYLLGLQWSPQRNVYDQTFFVQLNFNLGAGHLVIADVNGDGRNDVVVFGGYFETSVARAYDGTTGAFLKTLQFNNAQWAVSADIDGVPGDEIIVNDSGISAYKGEVQLWHSPVVGQLLPAAPEATVRRELVVSTATEVIVLDARTGQERRRLPLSCGMAAVGHSQSSPAIACNGETALRLVDGTTGAVRWSQPTHNVRKVSMFDANGDGVDDVILRSEVDVYQELVTVLNGKTGLPLGGSKTLRDSGLILGIRSGCDFKAVVAVEGTGSTSPDNLWLFDGATFETKSVYALDSYGVTGIAIADFDGDGRNELNVAHNGLVSTVRFEPRVSGDTVTVGEFCCSYRGMAAAQLDRDAAAETIVSGLCDVRAPCITAWDGPKLSHLWSAKMDGGEIANTVVVADVDGDGADDVLTSTIAVDSGAKGQFVYAFRGRDGKALWRSINLPGSTGRVRVADVEGKGTLQALALSRTIGIVRLNLASGTVSSFDEFKDGRAFATYSRPGDSRARTVVAAGTRLFVLDGGQVVTEVNSPDFAGTTEIEIADIDGDGVPEILMAEHNANVFTLSVRLQVRSIDTLALLWTSEDFPMLINFGQIEQIAVGDVDNDGAPEVVFLSSLSARVFKVDRGVHGTVAPRFDSVRLNANVGVHSCCATVLLNWDHARTGDAPPLQYRIYRSSTAGGPETLLATTGRNEFADQDAGAGARYRYSIEVVDAAGQVGPQRLTTEVKVPSCYRPPGKR